jgi:uncharacterized protein YkwD
MPNCEYCGAEVELPFKCNFCGSLLCIDHRLPENHACIRQPPRKPLGSWDSKKTIERARRHKWSDMESEGEFHFKKKTRYSYNSNRRQYKTGRRKKRVPVRKVVSAVTAIVGVLAIGLIIGFFLVGSGGLITSSISISQTKDEIFKGINEQRTNLGLPILGNDSALVSISNSWSNQLASMDTLTHGDFEGRIASIGYSYYSCGEIIGSFQSGSVNGIPDTRSASDLAKEFVNMWLNSPPHREIMLTASNGYMGVGLSKSGSAFYGVVDFRFG